jgi:hypothetical protein
MANPNHKSESRLQVLIAAAAIKKIMGDNQHLYCVDGRA